jgi:endonuclease YncB( thermonuclease family)
LFGEAPDSEEQPESLERGPEAHGPLLGIVFAESGACLNLEQVKAGLATCLASAPKEWHAAESAAKKAKLGIWAVARKG